MTKKVKVTIRVQYCPECGYDDKSNANRGFSRRYCPICDKSRNEQVWMWFRDVIVEKVLEEKK
jgi:hypothetical protein